MTINRFTGFSSDSQPEAEEKTEGVDLQWALKVSMRDGVTLNATLYRPHKQSTPLPVIIGLTPYNADSYHKKGMHFAQSGYVFAAVDCRGRGNSDGVFEPVIHESRDTHDLVEWFGVQSYCNGQVTMSGASYGGFDQWAAICENPSHLKAILPTAAGYPSFDFPFANNIFSPYFIDWLTLTSGKPVNFNIFGEQTFWADAYFDLYKNHRPLVELDTIAGNTSTFFQTWMQNKQPGPYWDQTLPQEEHYRRLDIPVLSVTGHFDGDQKGALGYYADHMRWGKPEVTANHYLVIGPWDHGGTGNPQKQMGGLTFADISVVDMGRLHKEWYDWVLKDGPKPEFLKKRVTYYMMDAEEWKYADTLEDVGKQKQQLYLSSADGKVNEVYHSGLMQTQPVGVAVPDTFVYDPLDTRTGEMERELAESPNDNALLNQTMVLNLFGNGLVYHSERFEKPTGLSGFMKLTAFLELDVPDTDFEVSLYEIQPDGTSIFLAQDQKRARFRESLREEKFVPPGEIVKYTFSGFTFFSRRLRKGSRLRLVFKCVNSIHSEKNYNSGKPVHLESGVDARTAHVKLYHDSQHPSCLELPLD